MFPGRARRKNMHMEKSAGDLMGEDRKTMESYN